MLRAYSWLHIQQSFLVGSWDHTGYWGSNCVCKAVVCVYYSSSPKNFFFFLLNFANLDFIQEQFLWIPQWDCCYVNRCSTYSVIIYDGISNWHRKERVLVFSSTHCAHFAVAVHTRLLRFLVFYRLAVVFCHIQALVNVAWDRFNFCSQLLLNTF